MEKIIVNVSWCDKNYGAALSENIPGAVVVTAKSYDELIDEVRNLGGTFSCIFHNQNLCEDFGWEGWRKVYEDVLQYASQN